jgi:FkbM family methyltransferase
MYPETPVKFGDQKFLLRGFSKDDHIFNHWKKSGCFYEEALLRVAASLGLAGCYIDAGANVGNHTVFFAAFCECDEVISVEASAQIYEILRYNCKDNVHTPCVTVNKCLYSERGLFAESSEINSQNCGDTVFTVGDTGSVGTTTIDSLAQGRNVSLIKLDIRGGELNALKGSVDTLQRCSPALFIETTGLGTPEHRDVDDYLAKFGYIKKSSSLAAFPTFLWMREKC